MAFDANGQWKVEDDSVAPRVNELVSQDSPLIRQAQKMGEQAGNRRGLLNSSISAGVGAGAAYAAAVPIASQEASQTAQKNVATMTAGFAKDQAAQQGDIQSRLQAEQGTIQGGLLDKTSAAEMARLQAQLGNSNDQQKREIQARIDQLNQQAGIDTSARDQQFTQTKALNEQAQGFQKENLILQGDINSRLDLSRIDAQSKANLVEQDARIAASLKELTMNLSASDRQNALAQSSALIQSQDNVLQSILNNDKMDSATRTRLINDNTARREVALDLVGQFYNVELHWGNQTTPDSAPLTYTDRPLTKAEIKEQKKNGTYQGV